MKKLALLFILIPAVGFGQISVKSMYERVRYQPDNWGVSIGHYSKTNEWSSYGFEISFHEADYDYLNMGFFPKLEQWGFNLHAGPKFGFAFGSDDYDFSGAVGGGYTILDRLELGYRHTFTFVEIDGDHRNYGVVYLGINL